MAMEFAAPRDTPGSPPADLSDQLKRASYLYPRGTAVSESLVRLEQQTEIIAELDGGHSAVIRGPWRVGKTTMLDSIESALKGATPCLTLDMNTIPTKSAAEFAQAIGDKMAAFCTKLPDGPASREEARSIFNDLPAEELPAALNAYLETLDQKACVLIDEVTGVADNRERLEAVAKFQDLSHIRAAFVLHYISWQEEAFAEFFGDLRSFAITPLSDAEISLLAHSHLQNLPVAFGSEALSEISTFSGGRPLEINILCFELLQRAAAKSLCFKYLRR